MLTIRENQVDALSASMQQHFMDRMRLHLRRSFPEETASFDDSELRLLIKRQIARAKTFQITSKRDVRAFLECTVIHGEGFGESDETRWASDILNSEVFSGTMKMNRIRDYEVFTLKGGGDLKNP